MKVFKTITVAVCILLSAVVAVTAESSLDSSFNAYGIKTIGIYTEAYEDMRSDNFLAEVSVMQSNPMLTVPSFYRNQYCNFDLVTPTLTTPDYPLEGGADGVIDESLVLELTKFLDDSGYQVEQLSDFNGGVLSSLLEAADLSGLDAALVVRYTPFRYFIPVDSYHDDWFTGRTGIITGNMQVGLGYMAALELYDTETGTRLWYSAYHASKHGGSSDKEFIDNVADAGEFFAEFNITENEGKAAWAAAELIPDFDYIWSNYDVDERAAELLVELTMSAPDSPFPPASESKIRNAPITASRLQHVFWTDHPSFRLHGTKWGIGYSFDYVGKYNLYFRDDSYGSSENDPSEIIETNGAMMHSFLLPFYSVEFGNLSIEPDLVVGYMPPYSATITYNNLANDPPWSDDVYIASIETETAEISGFSVGFDLNLKYFFRFGDRFSFFLGAQADAIKYFSTVESDAERPIQDRGSFRGDGEGLFFIEGPDLTITAAAIAGVRFDTKNPFEFFAMYHPVGQAGDLASPTISAGIRWLPLTWGWTEPHQKHVTEDAPLF